MLAGFVEKVSQQNGRVEAVDFEVVGDDKIIAHTRFLDEHDRPTGERFRVLTIRNGRIIDWQDVRTRRTAHRFARTP